MFGFEKMFGGGKKEETKEEVAPVVEVKEEEVVQKTPKTLEKVLEAKEDIEALEKRKEEILEELRDKKDEARAAGVQEFKNKERGSGNRTDTFNDLVNDTEKELFEIRNQISDKKEEFDLQPNQVQVLEGRMKKVTDEIERIKNKMAPEYRGIKSGIKNYFGEGESMSKFNSDTLNRFREHILKENTEIPEVKEFYEKVKDMKFYEENDERSFILVFKEFKRLIDEKISEKTVYKTPAEEKEAHEQIQRGVRLLDDIHTTLKDAQNKEGRFEKPNPKHF